MTTAKESIEIISDLSSKGYEATKSLGAMNLRIMERIMARQMGTFNLIIDSGLRNAKMVNEVKAPNDLVRGQLDLVREVSERLLTEGRETVKLANDSRDEYRAWFEQGMQVISEKMGNIRPAI